MSRAALSQMLARGLGAHHFVLRQAPSFVWARGARALATEAAPDGVEQRKQAALKAFVEQQLGGEDNAELAELLAKHGVVIKGGQEQALQLMEALQAWKRRGSQAGAATSSGGPQQQRAGGGSGNAGSGT